MKIPGVKKLDRYSTGSREKWYNKLTDEQSNI